MTIQGKQLNALLRKSFAYQKKNWCLNGCLISSPILIAVLLAILQALVNNLLDEACGCECLRCVVNGQIQTDSTVCNDLALRSSSDWTCLDENSANCGPEYSTAEQVLFCPITSPSRWPPVYELTDAIDPPPGDALTGSEAEDDSESGGFGGRRLLDAYKSGTVAVSAKRAILQSGADRSSRTTSAYTAGNLDFANSIMSGLFRQPSVQGLVTQILPNLQDLGLASSIDLSLMSRLPWDIGVYNREALGSLYLDQAFLSSSRTVAADCALLQGFLDDGTVPSVELPWFQECVTGVVEPVATVDEVNALLYCTFSEATENRGGRDCPVQTFYGNAFDWHGSSPGNLQLDIWHNDWERIGGEDGITSFKRIAKPMDRSIHEFLQAWLGLGYTARVLAFMDTPKGGSELTLDFSSFLGTLFFLFLIQLPLPIALSQLVYEKEKHLRTMMRMHGLSTSVYIAVTYLYLLVLHILFIALLLVSGVAAGLQFFRRNSIGVQIVFYFLYSNVQIALAFLLSCLFSKARTAIITGYLWVFGSAILASQLMEPFYVEERWFTFVVQLIPTFGAHRGLWELGQYSFKASYQNSSGMGFGDLWLDGNGMGVVLVTFVLEWPVFILLAWYLEQVLGTGIGIRRHPLFFLRWHSREARLVPEGDAPGELGGLSRDALKERDNAYRSQPSPDVPIVVRDMRKVYPAQGGNPTKIAVSNLSMAVKKSECFGLLGPNGAGKSTSIHMMIGFTEASSGRAYINGLDISTEISEVYRSMGVCPQHDLLWEMLTAEEHLYFYARLKGLVRSELRAAVDDALRAVRLTDAAKKRIGKYSGGMKRRLSVAISLIGNPSVVYLDEPSTGLDPSARRNLWDVVQKANANKAVILTTHSMEEAEVLCDRLGIFVDGRLVCVGDPKQLTARFGGYYVRSSAIPVFNITVDPQQTPEERVIAFVKSLSSNAKSTYCLSGSYKYEIPCEDIRLSVIFARVAESQEQNKWILDWGVHNASLEDVFIRLAQEAQNMDL